MLMTCSRLEGLGKCNSDSVIDDKAGKPVTAVQDTFQT